MVIVFINNINFKPNHPGVYEIVKIDRDKDIKYGGKNMIVKYVKLKLYFIDVRH